MQVYGVYIALNRCLVRYLSLWCAFVLNIGEGPLDIQVGLKRIVLLEEMGSYRCCLDFRLHLPVRITTITNNHIRLGFGRRTERCGRTVAF